MEIESGKILPGTIVMTKNSPRRFLVVAVNTGANNIRVLKCLRLCNNPYVTSVIQTELGGKQLGFDRKSSIYESDVVKSTPVFTPEATAALFRDFRRASRKQNEKTAERSHTQQTKKKKYKTKTKTKPYKPPADTAYPSDGLRVGNPWAGLRMSGRSSKFYKG